MLWKSPPFEKIKIHQKVDPMFLVFLLWILGVRPSIRCPRWWPSQYRDRSIPTGTGCSVLAPKRRGCIRRREPKRTQKRTGKFSVVFLFLENMKGKVNQELLGSYTRYSVLLKLWAYETASQQLPAPSQVAIKQTKNSKSFRASKVVDSTCLAWGLPSELIWIHGNLAIIYYEKLCQLGWQCFSHGHIAIFNMQKQIKIQITQRWGWHINLCLSSCWDVVMKTWSWRCALPPKLDDQ